MKHKKNKPTSANDGAVFKECTRRSCLGWLSGAALFILGGCKENTSDMPVPPYGRALDVTQANTFVEFDIRIDKPDQYDVVLEVFKKEPKERVPNEVWDSPNAHFKVRIQSLSASGEVILEKEVKNKEGLSLRTYVGPSSTEKTDRMKFTKYLIPKHMFNKGLYRIHCDNLNPIPSLEGRLVKVSVLHKVVYK